ncbi:MAG: glutamate--tRNA ligase [Armatimonadetes bacterium]|nr:glutamate--tRNA ligase [Armatimonadota bacterium]
MTPDKPRLRMAPSPTGSPHIGNIRTAVFDYLYARHTGGTFILRIEDTDRNRFVEGALEEMMYALRWMGMQWDEGPEAGGDFGPYFQSQRLDIYHQYADRLVEQGRAYRCYCTRERLEEMRKVQEAAKLPPGYDRRCRNLSKEESGTLAQENPNPVIRFAMNRDGTTELDDVVRGHVSFRNDLQDDFIIIKADGFPTYHFASVVDDHLMKITHVVRGDEWLSSAPKHVQIYEALGWQAPVWVHPSLILDESGKKLSKRSEAQTRFLSYIEDGYLPEAMLNFLATMGWSAGEDRKLYSREELIEKFALEGITNHPAIFDLAKLNDLQGEYIRMLAVEQLADMIQPRLQQAGYIGDSLAGDDISYLLRVTALIQDRLVLLNEAADMVSYFYSDEFEYDEKGARKHLAKDTTPAILKAVISKLSDVNSWTVGDIESAMRAVADDLAVKAADIIHPTRMAVTGRTWGPGLFELMEVIGKSRVVARLERCAGGL